MKNKYKQQHVLLRISRMFSGAVAAMLLFPSLSIPTPQEVVDYVFVSPDEVQEESVKELSETDSAVTSIPGFDGWWTSVQQEIVENEYKPSLQQFNSQGDRFENPRWHFINRTQSLRTYVSEHGYELQHDEQSTWAWQYQAQTLSRNNFVIDIPQKEITSDGKHITIHREAGVDEWYENSFQGIKQNFTIYERPAGEGALVITGSVATDLVISEKSENEVVFVQQDGRPGFRYKDLVVRDANGVILPAAIDVHKSIGGDGYALDLRINDDGAMYPIFVDPISTTADWSDESDQASAELGNSVMTAGDVNGDGYSDVIIGLHLFDGGQADEGAAYVYYGSFSGLSATPDWTVESDEAGAQYGTSVSTAGDVNGDGYSDVIIGSSMHDESFADGGAAFVYHGSASGLSASANWTGSGGQASEEYGTSVVTAGDVNGDGYSDVIVGSPAIDTTYVYHGSASGLSATANWTEVGGSGSEFGTSVSTAGDVNGDGYSDVIVGASMYSNGESAEGSAYVYHGSASGLSGTADWSDESDQADAAYGISVSTAGDVNGDGYSDVIIGAYLYDNGQANEGRAFTYYGSGSGLSATPDWTQEPDIAGALYGWAVASGGDVNGDGYGDVVVGAYQYANGQSDEGAVYVYEGTSSGLPSSPEAILEIDQASSQLGYAVSTAGDVNGDGYSDVLAGAQTYTNGESEEGAAFIFNGSADGLSTSSSWTKDSNQVSSRYSFSASSIGDINGDGYGDVGVGAYLYDNGQSDEGVVFIYHGSATGLSSSADTVLEPDQANTEFGFSVANAGDVNGDGYSDVVVGAWKYDNIPADEGAAYLYLGSSSGVTNSPDWMIESNNASAQLGSSVASAGDVNGDGYSDVIVGAYAYSNGQSAEGIAYLYYGSSSGLSSTADWSDESDQADAAYGISVSTAGDVNGDGYSDVIIGVRSYDGGQTDEGAAHVYHGSSSGLSATPDWTVESDQANALMGRSVSNAGDVNGDGYSDVIVGVLAYTNGQSGEGAAFAYYGSASGLSGTADWSVESNQASARFGFVVSNAGDVNGDGYSDVIVGAYLYDNGQIDEGRAYAYYGGSTGLSSSADWTVESNQASAGFGIGVSNAGDVNGDGYSDVIVGAWLYDNGQADEGQAFLYYGNNAGGLAVVPRQQRPADSSLIHPLNASSSETSVQLRLLGRTPLGRTATRLVWEVKEFGTAFANTGLGKGSSWTDIGTAGSAITETISGLANSTLYHWRARFQYFPYLNYSPWFSVGSNGAQEADFLLPSPTPDVSAPVVSTLSPSDDATEVAIDSNLGITFDEDVDTETGNITIKRSDDDSTFEAIDVTSGQVTGTGTDTITINPSSDFVSETSYYVQIDATAFDDSSSNSYAGIADTTTWNFTTDSLSAVPSVSAPTSISQATDGSGYVTFKASISDDDNEVTSLRAEYSTNNSTWKKIDVKSVGASQGDVVISNSDEYQIQYIDTDTGKVDLTIVWSSKNQFPDQYESNVYLRLTPYDGVAPGSAKTSESFKLDNKPPVVTSFAQNSSTNTSVAISWDQTGSEESFSGYMICYGLVQSNVNNGCINGSQVWDKDDDTALSNFDTSSTTINGLVQDTTYYLRLVATDEFGNVAAQTLTSKTSNVSPFLLSLKSVAANTVVLDWGASVSNTFSKYEVCYGTNESSINGAACGAAKKEITEISINTITISDLLYAIKYFFTVRVFDTANSTTTSNVLGVTTCAAGQTQVAGVCINNPTPVPVITLSAAPTPEPEEEDGQEPEEGVITAGPDVPAEPIDSGASSQAGIDINFDPIIGVVSSIFEFAREVIAALAEGPAKVGAVVREAAEKTIDHPATVPVNTATAAVAGVTAVAAIPTLATTTVSLSGQLPYLAGRIWQGFFGLLGARRKRRPWGRVVDAATGKPLPGVSIRIVDTANRSGVTTVSGPDGSYYSYLPPGQYTIRVFKSGWDLDSDPPALSTLVGEQIYTGESVTVTAEKLIPIVIPMHEIEHKMKAQIISWSLLWQQFESILSRVSWPIIAVGVVFNTFTMFGEINMINGLIELLYAFIISLKLVVQARYRVSVGRIIDEVTGAPLPLAIIRLYDIATGRIVATKVTTDEGKFFILAAPGTYTMQVVREGYAAYRESRIVVESKGSEALSMTIEMHPEEAREMGIQEA